MSATWSKERSTVEKNEIMKTAAHRSESWCWRQLLSLLSHVLMLVLTQLVCGRPYIYVSDSQNAAPLARGTVNLRFQHSYSCGRYSYFESKRNKATYDTYDGNNCSFILEEHYILSCAFSMLLPWGSDICSIVSRVANTEVWEQLIQTALRTESLFVSAARCVCAKKPPGIFGNFSSSSVWRVV
jgi:hypothetical protein